MVVVKAAVPRVPLGANAPVHPPEAVQAAALVEVHVRVVVAPLPTAVGAALIDAVGGAGCTFCPALQAINSSKAAIDRAWARRLARSMNALTGQHRYQPDICIWL